MSPGLHSCPSLVSLMGRESSCLQVHTADTTFWRSGPVEVSFGLFSGSKPCRESLIYVLLLSEVARNFTSCVIMHFTHLSWRSACTRRKIHCDGPSACHPAVVVVLFRFSGLQSGSGESSAGWDTLEPGVPPVNNTQQQLLLPWSPHITDLLCFWIFVFTT